MVQDQLERLPVPNQGLVVELALRVLALLRERRIEFATPLNVSRCARCFVKPNGLVATRPITPIIALAVFLFLAAVTTTPVLSDDDPVRDRLDRGFDLYPGDPEPFNKMAAGGGLATPNTGPASTRAETERFQQRMRTR